MIRYGEYSAYSAQGDHNHEVVIPAGTFGNTQDIHICYKPESKEFYFYWKTQVSGTEAYLEYAKAGYWNYDDAFRTITIKTPQDATPQDATEQEWSNRK